VINACMCVAVCCSALQCVLQCVVCVADKSCALEYRHRNLRLRWRYRGGCRRVRAMILPLCCKWCIYIFIYSYIHTCVYVSMFVSRYVYIHRCKHIHRYVYMAFERWLQASMNNDTAAVLQMVYSNIAICIYFTCVLLSMYVCVCVYIYILLCENIDGYM